MSETPETSQLAIRPYVKMAAVGLVLYAWTAVFREALVVKVPGCEGGEGGSTATFRVNIGSHDGGKATPPTGSCVFELCVAKPQAG